MPALCLETLRKLCCSDNPQLGIHLVELVYLVAVPSHASASASDSTTCSSPLYGFYKWFTTASSCLVRVQRLLTRQPASWTVLSTCAASTTADRLLCGGRVLANQSWLFANKPWLLSYQPRYKCTAVKLVCLDLPLLSPSKLRCLCRKCSLIAAAT